MCALGIHLLIFAFYFPNRNICCRHLTCWLTLPLLASIAISAPRDLISGSFSAPTSEIDKTNNPSSRPSHIVETSYEYFIFVWRRYENMTPCTGSRVNASYEPCTVSGAKANYELHVLEASIEPWVLQSEATPQPTHCLERRNHSAMTHPSKTEWL